MYFLCIYAAIVYFQNYIRNINLGVFVAVIMAMDMCMCVYVAPSDPEEVSVHQVPLL